MKFKTTNANIKNGYYYILKIGYCDAQNLLRYTEARAYTCGVYGWNYDVYDVDGVAICTGYRGMPGERVNYDNLKKYEKQAEKIARDYNLTYDKQREKVNKLLKKFVDGEINPRRAENLKKYIDKLSEEA